LRIRKRNYVFRFDFKFFYLRYRELDISKEGNMTEKALIATDPNWKELTNRLINNLEEKPTDKDLLIGRTKILI